MSIVKKVVAVGAAIAIITIYLVTWVDPKYDGLTESQISEIKQMEEDCEVQILQTIIEEENFTSVEEECAKKVQDQIDKFRVLNENP